MNKICLYTCVSFFSWLVLAGSTVAQQASTTDQPQTKSELEQALEYSKISGQPVLVVAGDAGS